MSSALEVKLAAFGVDKSNWSAIGLFGECCYMKAGLSLWLTLCAPAAVMKSTFAVSRWTTPRSEVLNPHG